MENIRRDSMWALQTRDTRSLRFIHSRALINLSRFTCDDDFKFRPCMNIYIYTTCSNCNLNCKFNLEFMEIHFCLYAVQKRVSVIVDRKKNKVKLDPIHTFLFDDKCKCSKQVEISFHYQSLALNF